MEKKRNVHQLLNMLGTKLRKFLYHYFINKRQSEAHNSCKVLATSESFDTVKVEMDFSENFSSIYQDKKSSAHWKINSVTLYTVMVWFREHKILTVSLSDTSIHEKTAVVPYTIDVLDYIWESFGADVKQVEVWNDGPRSQFKKKFAFAFIGIPIPVRHEFKVTWNYSATSHGKGAVDGIGGLIKRLGLASLVTRQAIIKDVKSMYDVVNAKTKLKLAFISDEYVADMLKNLGMKSQWDFVRVLTGRFYFHCFKPTQQKENIKASHFKADESFIIYHVTESSLEVSTREDALKIFATGNYVVVKDNNTYSPGEIVNVFPDTESARVSRMEKSGPKF